MKICCSRFIKILAGICLVIIVAKSGIVGSFLYWSGLVKGKIQIDILEMYDMKQVPFGGYYPSFQVSSAKGKKIFVMTTKGKVSNVDNDQARMMDGKKPAVLRNCAVSNGNAEFWWGSDSERWWDTNDTYSIYVIAQKYGIVLERRRFTVKKLQDKKYFIKGKNVTKVKETGGLIVDRREDVQRITGTYKGETWKTITIDFNQLKRNSSDSIEIAKEAFRHCYELENLVIKNWDDSISLSVDDEAFLNSPDHLIVYCPKDTKKTSEIGRSLGRIS